MTNWENIVDEKALKDAAKLRKSPYYEVKDYTSAKEDRAIDGWEAVSPCDAERSKLAKNQSYSVPRKAFMTIEEVYLWLNQ